MSYRIEQLPGEPIVISSLDSEFSVSQDLANLSAEAARILDASGPVFYVIEVRGVKVSFEDLVVGASASARGAGTILHHPNIREAIVVTTDKLISMTVKGLNSQVFGGVAASVFETLEEALAHCREKAAVV